MAMLKSACIVLSVFLSLSFSLAHRPLLDQAIDDQPTAEAPQLGVEKINPNGVGIGYGSGSGGGSGYGVGYGSGSGAGCGGSSGNCDDDCDGCCHGSDNPCVDIPEIPPIPKIPDIPPFPKFPPFPEIPPFPRIPDIPPVPKVPIFPVPKFPPTCIDEPCGDDNDCDSGCGTGCHTECNNGGTNFPPPCIDEPCDDDCGSGCGTSCHTECNKGDRSCHQGCNSCCNDSGTYGTAGIIDQRPIPPKEASEDDQGDISIAVEAMSRTTSAMEPSAMTPNVAAKYTQEAIPYPPHVPQV